MGKLESWGYPTDYSEDPMIVAEVVLTQCQRVTDGRTDGFMIASTVLSTASYADC